MPLNAQPALTHPLPPPRTSCILRHGRDAVTYHIPNSPPLPPSPHSSPESESLKTTIHLPPNSAWTSGLHYHARHTEYLSLLRGCITVRLNSTIYTISAALCGSTPLASAQACVVEIPPYARHEWRRADTYALTHARTTQKAPSITPDDWNDDVVVEEWTAPSDLEKALFFWNLNGVITAAAPPPRLVPGRWWVGLQLWGIFWELDNWPVFWDLEGVLGAWVGERVGRVVERGVEGAVGWVVLGVASVVGRVLGLEAVCEERTPGELWVAWKRESEKGRSGEGKGKEE